MIDKKDSNKKTNRPSREEKSFNKLGGLKKPVSSSQSSSTGGSGSNSSNKES